ncbi:NAD(P)-binding protein [Multifurca ochricompacta]|uniref:NAD(P)-binding protein n=1 Tax=Multifurca ochricompacta TaxID=376703 RepID=A0AAD4QFP0_9AGAM|nr:NAD(P)-binding protein [Multifurca ochricompacta]
MGVAVTYPIGTAAALSLSALIPAWAVYKFFVKSRLRRSKLVPPNGERVLIIGASSGIGRTISLRYAGRGAKVCVVARRNAELEVVRLQCEAMAHAPDSVFSICADFTNAEDLLNIKNDISEKWHGLDTLIVAAGVSALRPVMDIVGVGGISEVAQPSFDGVQRVADVALAAIKGNYLGPLLSAVTMIPLMKRTSASPSILLVSSLGAVIPAPTRAIYGSSKAASHLLYQALSIENPTVNFSYVLPSTVEGDFRASAVDGGPIREADPTQVGLKREVVAERCIRAVDACEGIVFIPSIYQYAQLLLWLWPSYVKRKASLKYHFTPT